MLKKTIIYIDFNGNKRTEDFYFNLTRAEVAEMEMGTTGGYAEMLKRIVSAQDTPSIVRILKEFILRSYGEKSPDGKRFIKSDELSQAFAQTEAYSELFMELGGDADAAARFINGVLPSAPNDTAAPTSPNNTPVLAIT